MEDVARDTFLDADPSEVWEAVTEKASDWFGADVDGEFAQGECLRFTSPDGTERRAIVERVDPKRELMFRFLGDDPTRVRITIEEVPDGSVLHVVERRIDAATSPHPTIGFKSLARAGA